MKKELTHIEKGILGEKYVAKYLRRKGYRITKRNMRNRISEIDIIAENKKYILFVEVKTRTAGQAVPAVFAVNKHKQRKIILAAQCYMSYMNTAKNPRFDIAEVYISKDKNKVVEFNYYEGAF
ncbi:MAG: YraN family protein [Clostridia bacterium]|nr:YraN family protein [Clostridia bacterium]